MLVSERTSLSYRLRFDSGSPLEIARGVSTSVSSQGKAKNLGVIVIRRP